MRLTSRDEDLGSGGEVVVVFSPTVCSVVVLRLWGTPAGVCGNAWVVGGGRVVVRWWWVGGVGVGVEEGEGDWWWEVVESVSVGWQSARARECCGLWEETGGGSDGQGRAGLWARARQEQARQRDSQQASKQSGVPRSGGKAGDKSR